MGTGGKPFILTALTLVSALAFGQQPALDVVDGVIVDLFKRHNEQFLCLSQSSSLQAIRASIEDRLKGIDSNNMASTNAIATVVYTAFPCPFSPFRAELRVANSKDLEGGWLFPESSQRFRYGPKSPGWQISPGVPRIKCEGVSYYAGGEARVMQVRGTFPCPTSKEMEAMRKAPKVSTWSFIREGRLQIERSDVASHVEEWDVYVVDSQFEVGQVRFAPGDLVAYLRRSRGNDFNVATEFRHLQKLP